MGGPELLDGALRQVVAQAKRIPSDTALSGARWAATRVTASSENSRPRLLNSPGTMGMTTSGISTSAASAAACSPPAPPKAKRLNVRGSRPRSTDTVRTARRMLELTTE